MCAPSLEAQGRLLPVPRLRARCRGCLPPSRRARGAAQRPAKLDGEARRIAAPLRCRADPKSCEYLFLRLMENDRNEFLLDQCALRLQPMRDPQLFSKRFKWFIGSEARSIG